jgi:hypothetical protein
MYWKTEERRKMEESLIWFTEERNEERKSVRNRERKRKFNMYTAQ